MASDPRELLDEASQSGPDRPTRDMAGQTAINVPESAVKSVDSVLDWFGFPELGPVLHRVAPRNVADAFGVPTPDQVSDAFLRELDSRFDIRFPPER